MNVRFRPIADIKAFAIVTGMEHASLVAFLEGKLAPEQFGDEVGEEVSACNEAFRSEGLGYIAVTDGPPTTTPAITQSGFWKL